MNKSEIRKKIIKIRKKNDTKNLKINFHHILNILKKNLTTNKVIGGYYPYNYEVDTIEILKKIEKKNYLISLPKIKKSYKMNFFNWSTKDPLQINQFGIPEPTSNKIIYPSILLVPLVAFDKYNNRLGYGGGFYDRYINKIKKNQSVTTIGLAYSYQEIKKVPINDHDIKLDFIVTEDKIK